MVLTLVAAVEAGCDGFLVAGAGAVPSIDGCYAAINTSSQPGSSDRRANCRDNRRESGRGRCCIAVLKESHHDFHLRPEVVSEGVGP